MIVCVLTACRPPRKTITLYFTFPFSVIISARVLYALSCPIVSKPLSKRISYLAIPHPNTRRRQRPAPTIQNSMPPPLLQCHQGSAKMPSRPQIQNSGTCNVYVLFLLLLLPVCLPTCTHPPTFASPNAAFATSAPSVGSAKSPHGCLCHLTPIHSQVGSDATSVATLGGERWTCLEQACSGPMERLRRLEAAAAVQHHCNTRWRTFALLFLLFLCLLGVGLVKRWPFLYLQGTT